MAMNRQEFLATLRKELSGLPQEDIERSIDFYSEMIDDRMEDGLTEEEAIAAIGSVDEIVNKILSEISLPKLVKEKVKPNHTLRVWEIILLVLGFPVWLPLLLAAVIIVLAVYIVIWSVIISLYAVDFAFVSCGVGGILGSLTYFTLGNVAAGILLIGVGLISLGISILLFLGFNQITREILLLSKRILLSIKSCFIRKVDAK